jgi:putative endonuclease
MAQHNDFGNEAETQARDYLVAKNYTILAQNYRYLKAEVDLIARQNNSIVFVEVRARNHDFVVSPLESISKKKIKLLVMAANHFTENFTENIEVRFDVVSIIAYPTERQIEHIQDAFEALDAE